MDTPSPYPRRGRPRIEDEDEAKAREKNIRLPANFVAWFGEAAKSEGLTWHSAAREALLAWAKKHHP